MPDLHLPWVVHRPPPLLYTILIQVLQSRIHFRSVREFLKIGIFLAVHENGWFFG